MDIGAISLETIIYGKKFEESDMFKVADPITNFSIEFSSDGTSRISLTSSSSSAWQVCKTICYLNLTYGLMLATPVLT
jgi:hypothetical protein